MGIIAVLAAGIIFGYVLGNWEIVGVWIPFAGIALVIFLFYRLVVAVEYLAYES